MEGAAPRFPNRAASQVWRAQWRRQPSKNLRGNRRIYDRTLAIFRVNLFLGCLLYGGLKSFQESPGSVRALEHKE